MQIDSMYQRDFFPKLAKHIDVNEADDVLIFRLSLVIPLHIISGIRKDPRGSFTDRPPEYAAFVFRNVFFHQGWADDALASRAISFQQRRVINTSLVTAHKTRREARPGQLGVRSKYIAKPSLVIEAGNHFPWEVSTGASR